jgi:chromate reductase, NAD(P)H dehydrogenase (quinone)
MKQKLNILGFAGSLRSESYNQSLLRAAAELMPGDAILEIFDISGMPAFNQDIEWDMPTIVKDFKSKIMNTDAILISTPEYNYSVPGVLKNTIDWASRPYGDNSFSGKPVPLLVYLLVCYVVQELGITFVRYLYFLIYIQLMDQRF